MSFFFLDLTKKRNKLKFGVLNRNEYPKNKLKSLMALSFSMFRLIILIPSRVVVLSLSNVCSFWRGKKVRIVCVN